MNQAEANDAQENGSSDATSVRASLIISSLAVGLVSLGLYNVWSYEYEMALTDGPPFPNPEGVLGTFALFWLVAAITSVVAYFRLTDKKHKSFAMLFAVLTAVACLANAWFCVVEAFKF